MFGFVPHPKKDARALAELHEELRRSKQEREAARLGLASAVFRLVREVQSFPLDEKIEAVADDLAAAREDANEHQ
jgi:hypothetical protein